MAAKFESAQKLHVLAWLDFDLIKAGELIALTALELALTGCYAGKESTRRRKLVAKKGRNGYPLHCPWGTWYACLVDTTRHPVAGLDSPRTFQAMDERFRDDAACREYIRRLRLASGIRLPPLRRGGGAMGDGRGMAAVSGLPQTDIADRRDDLRGYP